MSDPPPRARSALELAVVSLLWPAGTSPNSSPQAGWIQDLGLEALARAFNTETRYTAFIKQTLANLTSDIVVIAWRQAVLDDFMRNPALAERFTALLPRLADLRMGHALLGKQKRNVLLETADRLAELDLYLGIVRELHEALHEAQITSEALRQLHQNLQALMADENFQALSAELPALQRPIQSVASVTVGINLDAQLRPLSAALLAINEQPFTEPRSLLGKLLGSPVQPGDESAIAPLHHVPADPDDRKLSVLFQDLERLLAQIAQPVVRALYRYVRISSGPLAGLENELVFYTAAVTLYRRLKAQGIPVCQPEIAPTSERISQIEGLVNINLALREPPQKPVANSLTFDDQGRIALLTGPNSGGKTTYLQAVGLAYVLFQAGLPVPAQRARLSPVDAIFTHFPVMEMNQGRFFEEAARLRTICLNATPYSLVLLNESLSSTTASEGSYVAQELLAGLRAIGVRAIYATHLVELADHLGAIEASVDGESSLFSLVAGMELVEDVTGAELRVRPTFQITRGLPQERGYAREIARRAGISLEQILQARKVNAQSGE